MYVHERTRLAYLANPRTASRATAKALRSIGFEMRGSHHSFDDCGCGFTLFTTIRDPLELEQSWARKFGCPVEEVPARMRKQRAIIDGWESGYLPHEHRADRVLRYAHLQEDLNALLAGFGLPAVELERIP